MIGRRFYFRRNRFLINMAVFLNFRYKFILKVLFAIIALVDICFGYNRGGLATARMRPADTCKNSI